MLILTLETTCDETSAAVIDDQLAVRGAVVASQDELHRRYGGVVPEVASRAHVERVVPVIHAALEQAHATPRDLAAVAVCHTPGLAGSLVVGVAAAKALAVALDLPLIGIHHLQAHIYACRMAYGPEVFPCVGLIASGGHSNLYRCNGPLDFEFLGATIDDAAGEAFDKVASLLGLPYPGGPSIAKAAETGNPAAFAFPRSLVDQPDRLEFSFSGLKTAVRYQLAKLVGDKHPESPLSPATMADVAASFQEAVVDVLVAKCQAALRGTGLSALCLGGGVAANRRLREKCTAAFAASGQRLYIAPPHLCTDNAVMGAIAWERYRAGLFESLTLDAIPGLVRGK